MKKVLFLSVILVMILSGCNFSTPADIDFDEWGLGGPTEHGRSARIGNVVLYDCTASYGTFIKSENDDIPQKLEDISKNFAIDKISSSKQYFYLSGRGISEEWEGKINVLVVDINGNIVAAKKCCCIWIYACDNMILGYYNGDEEDEEDESSVGWDATRREITHFADEEEFLKNEEDDIENWTKIIGDSYTVAEKEWFRQKKDDDHSVPYYTDTVYSDVYDALMFLLYVDGRESSGQDTEKSEKYMKQMQEIMGGKEKNMEVSTRQSENKLFIVCRVYSQSRGFLQHFTKDIERSLLLRYDPDRDAVYLEVTYEGKEVAYWDGSWVIYRKDRELFLENLATHEANKVFESDVIIHIDVSGDIVTLWDLKNEKLDHSHTVILQ